MGSWNETCAFTNLPIFDEDPVALFLLTGDIRAQIEGHAGSTSINSRWTPRYLPIYGTYNDYGSIENIEQSWNLNYIEASLQEDLTEFRLRTGKIHEYATVNQLDLTNFDIVDVLRAIYYSSVWVHDYAQMQPVGQIMIHRWVYDKFSQQTYMHWAGDQTLVDVCADGTKFYLELERTWPNVQREPWVNSAVQGKVNLSHSNKFRLLFQGYADLDGPYVGRGMSQYQYFLTNLIEKQVPVSDPTVQDAIKELARFLIFRTNMMNLNRQWMLTCTSGGIDSSLELHAQLLLDQLNWIRSKQEKRQLLQDGE